MNPILAFRSLTLQRQLTALLSVLAVVVSLTLLTQQMLKPKLDLLYSGLDGQVAGEVVAELAAKNVIYEVRGSAIYADASRRDALRLELAKDGLPRQSVAGYELFDDVNSFAMTSDMFNTAYWRAKEGELTRTILGLPMVNKARVHLGTAKRASFSKAPSAQSASVMVGTTGGMSPQTASAIQHLTALAVAGLDPSEVVVIDSRSGIVAGPGSANALVAGRAAGNMDGLDRAMTIKRNLLSIMEARVGSGNARVSVTLDVSRKRETTVERRFDPDGRVISSQVTSEVTDTSTGKNSPVSVASNLPDGDAAPGATNNSNRGESTETIQYEVSETVRNTEILPGAIKRMTVAIIVNDIAVVDADGVSTTQARSEGEMASLRELAMAASGINAEQGDLLTMKNFAFDVPDFSDAVEAPSLMNQFMDRYLLSMIQAGFLGLIALMLGMFVVKPLFTQTSGAGDAVGGLLPMEMLSSGALESTGLEAAEDPMDMLKSVTEENPSEAAALLSSWLDAELEETA